MSDTSRTPLWIKLLLGVSLAANLAIVGLVAGFALRGGPLGGKGPGAMGYAMPYVLALPREDRRGVFSALRRDDTLPNRRDRRAQFNAMIDALQTTPLDIPSIEAVLASQADGVTRVQKRAQSEWLSIVSAMSDEERIAYAARIKDVLKRGPDRKKGEPKR